MTFFPWHILPEFVALSGVVSSAAARSGLALYGLNGDGLVYPSRGCFKTAAKRKVGDIVAAVFVKS